MLKYIRVMDFAPVHMLIVDAVHPVFMKRLEEAGLNCSYQPTIDASEIADTLKDYTGILVRSKINITQPLLEQNPQLKLIARAGSGMDNVDVSAAEARGIKMINCPEANCDAVGEQALGMLLSLAHNIVKGNSEMQQNRFDREGNRGVEIGSRTIGIIGYGHTGSAFANKLRGFGSRIVAYDKYKTGFGDDQVEEVSLPSLLDQADVISFHVPLTSETRGWIGTDFIQSVRKSFVLLNLSRGGIMKTEEVIKGLQDGKITHLGLDVLENEKLETMTRQEAAQLKVLNDMQNVVITPHVGGWSAESYQRISEVLADKILTWQNKLKKDPRLSGQIARFVG